MTQDEIIRMAREAGLLEEGEAWVSPHQEAMERFATLVAAHEREKFLNKLDGVSEKVIYETIKEAILAEREACAKVCDDESKKFLDTHMGMVSLKPDAILGATTCAAAIRARGEA